MGYEQSLALREWSAQVGSRETKKNAVWRSFYCELVLVNADALLILGHVLETNHTARECEKGIVLTATYVLTGVDMSSALSDNDIAGDYALAVSLLRTKTLGLRVTAVLGGTNALLMSKELKIKLQHRFLPPLIVN
jgi:hypothetical protein